MPIVLRPLVERSSLTTRLADLGRSRKAARLLAGAFGVLAVLLAGFTLGIALDAALGLQPVARAAALVGTLAAAGVLFVRGLWTPLRESVGPQAMAHLLEARYPKLNDSLASAVDFQTAPDSPSTSARFRRIAVVRAQRALEKCDTGRLVPTAQAWRGFWLAAVAEGGV
jgi:hypothetical protein